MINNLRLIINNKKSVIITVGIIFALAIMAAKYMFTDTAVRHGNYQYVRMVQVENQNNLNFDYNAFLNSSANYYQYIDNANQDFDFTKINSAWKRKTKSEQIDWLKTHIKVTSFHSNAFVISVNFDGNITPDVDYMKRHGSLIVDDFIRAGEISLTKIVPEASFKIVSQDQNIPEIQKIDKKNGLMKFGFLGFLCGAIVTIGVLYLIEWKKSILKENK
ncbi:hypothetical protein [uncultured Megasphaera sp.]|uniref:hypothetical protein n=1 Tax=uncultured Megasphaera sp. TaxID=165188 RepID=UPI0025DA3855|nr:hypothetical protein [uncultured Megasphaera sp.]